MSSHVEKTIEVHLPVHEVYNQWTQFESFPHFMEGVLEVKQTSDKMTHWKAQVGPSVKEWDAEIVEQTPDTRIAWRAVNGSPNAGIVSFVPTEKGHTHVTAQITYDPEGFIEKVGDTLGFMSGRVAGDLERFKKFIEERGQATGAWRGEIHGGQVESKG